MTSPPVGTRSRTRDEGFRAGLHQLQGDHPHVRGIADRVVLFDRNLPYISAPAADCDPSGTARPDESFYRQLLEVRLGYSEYLLIQLVARLRTRPAGESTVLLQQLVKAQLGDISIAHWEIDASLSVSVLDTQHVRNLDRRITDVDRAILRLFGGWGYLVGEVSVCANVSEQLLAMYDRASERTL